MTALVFVLLTLIFAQQAFNLSFLKPDTSSETLIFAALSAIAFLLLVALSLMLARILLKLYADRRVGTLGSKFRTKMVLGALGLSFGPVIFLFIFAYGLMNRSIEKWFSMPVEQVRRDTRSMGDLLMQYAQQNAQSEARSIAIATPTLRSFQSGNFTQLMDVFRHREDPLQGGFAVALEDGDVEASFHLPVTWPVLRQHLGLENGQVPQIPESFDLNGTRYLIGVAPVNARGMILVGMPLPEPFTQTMSQIEDSQHHYLALSQERKTVRRTYMLLLMMLTMVVLFAASWFAVFMSKFVTRPVLALAEATEEISRGRLDYRVDVPASDELGKLVNSFNVMAAEIQMKRQQLEDSTRELAEANQELEQRRRQIETILDNIPTGVLSLDASLKITHANPAMIRMFRPESDGAGAAVLRGSHIRDVFSQELLDDLAPMVRKADRMGTTTSQMDVPAPAQQLNMAVTVASLKNGLQRQGYVVVFEDLSDLLTAQRQAAWREVARRVAHEIKNPLTPIALSAQRIKRHIEKGGTPDEASLAVISGCADTIAGAVETVRTLVDEFSTLARFPAAQVRPANINDIVESALAMFDGRLDGINVHKDLSLDLPSIMGDPEALKRAIANLVDNAAEAMEGCMVREIAISTSLLGTKDVVEVTVADTGHGLTQETKEKLFLPYFSTKRRGTGLGLAIVSRIVEDHHGSIRAEENKPVGARFILELPLASAETTLEKTAHA